MNSRNLNSLAYNKIAPDYNNRNFTHFWVNEFESFSKRLKGKRVLDIGCGAGRDAEQFIQKKYDYTGIDISEGMIEVAKKRVPEANFKVMDFYSFDFPNESFDGFWAAASFLHVPKNELQVVLAEAKRVLKKNGTGFISVKEKVSMDEGVITEDRYGGIKRYFAFYSSDELAEKLEQSGLKVIESGKYIEADEFNTCWLTFFVVPKTNY